MASFFSLFLSPFLLFNLHVFAELVLEEGYTVSTVLDGNKLEINPHSILPLFGASDLILLDSEHSAFFTVSLDAESAIKPLSGNGMGFSDGDLATATFSKPKSFAVDLSGNVYVADKGNRAIRKISKSGVTTIAGGSKTEGKADGPGQNASFSTDFELAFSPERCALMICDHGNKLVRQINLKSQDCARGSHSELGALPWAWAFALGVFCVGMIIGFAVCLYVTRYTGWFGPTPLQRDMEALPNHSAETNDTLLRHQKRNYSGLLGSKEMTKSQMYDERLKDLIAFDGGVEPSDNADMISEQEDYSESRDGVSSEGNQTIDNMIKAMGFEEQAQKASLEEPLLTSSGLVKRR